MSYSFAVKAVTKAAAIMAANAKLAEVVQQQPVHAHDMGKAAKIIDIVVGMVEAPKEGESVHIHVSGSLGWRDYSATVAESFNNASIHVSAHVARSQD
jgi:type IV secretory pathway VirJ component